MTTVEHPAVETSTDHPLGRKAWALFIAWVLLLVGGLYVFFQHERTEARETSASADVRMIVINLELASLETKDLTYPERVSIDDDSDVLLFDGEAVMVDGYPDPEPLVMSRDKTVTLYEVAGDHYRVCVVDDNGPWALYDTTAYKPLTSGTEGPACA